MEDSLLIRGTKIQNLGAERDWYVVSTVFVLLAPLSASSVSRPHPLSYMILAGPVSRIFLW